MVSSPYVIKVKHVLIFKHKMCFDFIRALKDALIIHVFEIIYCMNLLNNNKIF